MFHDCTKQRGIQQLTIAAELRSSGYDVVNADRRPGPAADSAANFLETDLADVSQVARLAARQRCARAPGRDALPCRHPVKVIFRNNANATSAVLQAASITGGNEPAVRQLAGDLHHMLVIV